MFKYILFVVLFVCEIAHAQTVRTVDADYINGSQVSFRNYAKNVYFEKNITGVTCTSFATCALQTTDAIQNAKSLELAATSASGLAKLDIKTFAKEMYGKNCEASVDVYTTASVVPHYDVYVEDNGTAISGTTTSMVLQQNKTQTYTINFPCGSSSSGPFKLVIDSTNTTGTNIKVDSFYAGLARNIGVGNIITNWQDFPSVAAGTLITATTSNPAYGTTVQNIARWRRVGDSMEINWTYQQSAASGNNGIGTYLFNLPSGYVIDTAKTGTNGSADNRHSNVGTFYYYNAGGPNIFNGFMGVWNSTQLYAFLNVTGIAWGSSVNYFNSGGITSFALAVKVPIVGWSTGNVVRMDQSNYDWTAYTPTFTGFGTVTNTACFHKRDGSDVLIRCKATTGTTTATEARISLPGSLVSADTVRIPTIQTASGLFFYEANGALAIVPLIEPSTAYLTFGLQTGSTAGLTKANANSLIGSTLNFTFFARVPIQGWTENQNAPLLVGGVTSAYSGNLRVEAAEINCDAASAITSQTGFLTSVGNRSTASCALTITSGIFAATPYSCQVTTKAATVQATACSCSSATACTIYGASADYDAYVTIVGPR